MEINVRTLLALPAAERLELAEILRGSVGYPTDIEILQLAEWRCSHLDRLLEKYASSAED